MAKTKLTTPVEGFTGVGPGGVVFDDGVGYTDDPAVINYCRDAGYGVGSSKAIDPNEVVQPPIDARDVAGPTAVGTPLRDAAVDPQPEDFLPPVNAGTADPHGPLVVAPGLHGVPPAPIIPGPVTPDLAAQVSRENEAAKAALIERKPADVVTPPAEGQGGDLALSDVSSAAVGAAAAAEGATVSDAAEHPDVLERVEVNTEPVTPGPVERPKDSANKPEWVDYAVAQGMARDDAEAMTKAELIQAYPAS